MTEYNIGLSNDRKKVYISLGSDDLPEGASDVLDDFTHGDDDSLNTWDGNHVLYHHVRDALYHEGILDMQRLEFITHGYLINSNGIVADKTITVEEADSKTLSVKYLPSGDAAELTDFDYESSDVSIATVSASGVVLGVLEGSVEITITHKDTEVAFTTKVPVTVTEPEEE